MTKRLASILLAVAMTSAGAQTPQPKTVRLQNHTLHTPEGQPFLALGASYFQALRRAHFDPARFESDLAFLAANGFNYVRTLSMVGWFSAWEGREIAPIAFKNRSGAPIPAMPDYWAALEKMIDRIHAHGMRAQITIFADAQLMPQKADRIAHMTRLLESLQGREHKIILLEVANEAWQNGFPGDQGVADLREFAQFLADRTSIPIAITSNHEGGLQSALALYKNSAADIATWHFSRDLRSARGPWEPVLDCLWTRAHPELPPFSSNEPIGPGSSVSSENDPARLVTAAAVAYAAGLPMYVYHTSAGVFGRDPFQAMPAATNFIRLSKLLPADLPNWTPNENLFATTGALTNITVAKANEFLSVPIALAKQGATLRALKPLALRVQDLLTGATLAKTNLPLNGEIHLPANFPARLIRGHLSPPN